MSADEGAGRQPRFIGSRNVSLRVIGQRGRIRLGLAVSIDDNPRERSRPAYLTHYKSGIVREREMPGDTVTRLWSLHRGIITVVMAQVDEEEEEEEERGVKRQEEGKRDRTRGWRGV